MISLLIMAALFVGFVVLGFRLIHRNKTRILYEIILGFQALLVTGYFLCRGGLGSGVKCEASIFSLVLETLLMTRELFILMIIPYLAVIAFLIAFPLIEVVYIYRQYKGKDVSSPLGISWKERTWYTVAFLILEGVLFWLAQVAHDTSDKVSRAEFEVIDQSNKAANVKRRLLLEGGSRGVPTEITPPSYPSDQNGVIAEPSNILPEQGSSEWISQVEGRFNEHDLGNNIVVLNDVTERFFEKYKRLPAHSAEFTNFVPNLKPRYKDETERAKSEGWIYSVLYRKLGERQFELCVHSDTLPLGLGGIVTWDYSDPYACLQRSI